MSDLNKLKDLAKAARFGHFEYSRFQASLEPEVVVGVIDQLEAAQQLAKFRGDNIASLDKLIADRDKRIADLEAEAEREGYITIDALDSMCEWMLRAKTAEAELDRRDAAAGEPAYYINRIEGSDEYGVEVDLRAYENQLDASKSKDDHGGVIVELFTAAQPSALPPDYFSKLVSEARVRSEKAMKKFPQPNYVLNKVAEESGEVIKEVIHYAEGRGDWSKVEYELVDNLAMLIRLVTEGDGVIGFTPPNLARFTVEGE